MQFASRPMSGGLDRGANRLARRVFAVLKRAADGDSTGYRFNDGQGNDIPTKESVRPTRSRYPSKTKLRAAAAEERKQGRRAVARGERQSEDSAGRVSGSPAPTSPNTDPHRQTHAIRPHSGVTAGDLDLGADEG